MSAHYVVFIYDQYGSLLSVVGPFSSRVSADRYRIQFPRNEVHELVLPPPSE